MTTETPKDPFASAKERGIQTRQALQSEKGGVITLSQASALLGVSAKAVERLERRKQMIGFPTEEGGNVYPVWQFDPEKRVVLPGLKSILRNLDTNGPWVQASWLLAQHTDLNGDTPLDRINQRRSNGLARLARSYGQHGAL